MFEIKYIVKPEEKMVIGVAEFEYADLYNELDNFTWPEREMVWRLLLHMEANEPFTIRATAKCKDGDVFNEEFGKKLVEAKINKKRHEKSLRYAAKILDAMDRISGKTLRLYKKHLYKTEHINKDLIEYFGMESE